MPAATDSSNQPLFRAGSVPVGGNGQLNFSSPEDSGLVVLITDDL